MKNKYETYNRIAAALGFESQDKSTDSDLIDDREGNARGKLDYNDLCYLICHDGLYNGKADVDKYFMYDTIIEKLGFTQIEVEDMPEPKNLTDNIDKPDPCDVLSAEEMEYFAGHNYFINGRKDI